MRHNLKRHKYNAKPTEVDGIRFDSKKEANYYKKVKTLHDLGKITMFLRQVPFHLPGGTKLVVDFLEFWADGSVRAVDVKGVKTDVYKLKKREVEHHYPITIEEV